MNAHWSATRVAPDGTHHLAAGAPLYEERFDEVLPFHAPGLAPVRRGDAAWHIDTAARPAYAARFRRTFGFYEGLAAVEAEEGWHHIRPDGSALYAERYAWCGNYQGGRGAVRDAEGRYLHLTTSGQPAYAARWRYAGDYREGAAVVQRDDGLSSHVDLDGRLVHDRWFRDLDVFHKGFARARDHVGWTHVNRLGVATHPGHFASVEPFYNGQARVERSDGGLAIVDERGAELVELRAAAQPRVGSDGAARIDGRYRLDTVLARSAWGSVWEAIDERSGALVVVKSARGGHAREVDVLSRLGTRPHVPSVLEVVHGADTGWIVLDRRPGSPLGGRNRCAPLAPGVAVDVALRVLDVVESLHGHGFAHTDLHPGNVLLDRAIGPESTSVLDYARAVPLDREGGWSGEVNWGTWEFVPPEQLRDFPRLDRSADTFAVAALLVYLVTGRACFHVDVSRLRARGWDAVRTAFLDARSQPLDLDGVPETLRPIVARALDPDPDRRFCSAAAMAGALASWSSHG